MSPTTAARAIRYIVIGLIMLVPLVALPVTNSMFFPFITGKNILFRVLVELIFGGWLVLAVADPRFRPKRSLVSYAFMAFVAVAGIAAAVGVNPVQSFWSNFERMEGFVTVLHLGALFLAMSTVMSRERLWTWFFHISIAVSALIGVMALMNVSAGDGGVLGNPIYLAVYMLFHIFLAGLYMLRVYPTAPILALTYAVVGLFEIYVLIATETRGTTLGLLAGAGVIALLIALLEKQRPVLKKAAWVVVVIGVIAAAGFGSVLVVNNTSEDVSNPFVRAVNATPFIGTLATIDLTSVNSATTRFYIWDMAIDGFQERPLLGWGQENFNYIFNKHYNPDIHDREQWFDRAHNAFLDWLVAGGVIGMAAYVSLYVALLWTIWRDRRSHWTMYEKSILTGLITAYAVHLLFVFDSITSYLMFTAVLAYAASMAGGSSAEERSTESRGAPTLAYGAVAPLMVIVVVASMYFSAYKPMAAATGLIDSLRAVQRQNFEKALERFRQARNDSFYTAGTQEIREQLTVKAMQVVRKRGSDSGIGKQFFSFADSEMQAHTSRFPNETRPYVFWAQLLTSAGDYKRATEITRTALEHSPKKLSIHRQLTQLLIEQEKYEAARDVAERAFELQPEATKVRIMYVNTLRFLGDEQTAQEVLRPLATSSRMQHDRLLQPYLEQEHYRKLIDIHEGYIRHLERQLDEEGDRRTLRRLIQEKASLAAVYMRADRQEQAIRELTRLKQEYPQTGQQVDQLIREIRKGNNPLQ